MKAIIIMFLVVFIAACQKPAPVKTGDEKSKQSKSEEKDKPAPKAVEKTRDEIDKKSQWNTTHIYKNKEAVEAAIKELESKQKKLKAYENTLANKTRALEALDLYFSGKKIGDELVTYAMLNKDVEMSNDSHQAFIGKAESLFAKFMSSASFIEPELLSLDKKILKAYRNDPAFKKHHRFIDQMIKNKKHTLSKEGEKILAEFSKFEYAMYETYSTFTNTEMPRETVELSDGKKVKATTPNYSKYRRAPVREDRMKMVNAFFKSYEANKQSLAKMLNYQINFYVTSAKIRNFETALDAEMHHNELPADFYKTLIKNIGEIVPSLHEYLKLRKEVSGLKDYSYYDMSAPLLNKPEKVLTYDQAAELVNKAMNKMPKEYVDTLKKSMAPGSGWIDVYPYKGKRSGAYSAGYASKAAHPYILLNHTDNYDSAFTLGHEMGHAMHSYFSSAYQDYPINQYNNFVAEVASVFNEIMMLNLLIDTTTDPDEKKYFLTHFLDMIKGTVFTQSMFAQFEYDIFTKVEKGEALTPDFLSDRFYHHMSHYYGVNKGIVNIDKKFGTGWAYIPHFYYNYYVYQYVVGLVGSLTLATKVYNGTLDAQLYVDNFLKQGNAYPPLEILKKAGADLTAKEPYQLLAETFKKRLNELKTLLTESNSESNHSGKK